MKKRHLFLGVAVLASTSYGQLWVSAATGLDTNACTHKAPCKTFAQALVQVPAGGRIDVLDPGDYGSVYITKAVTIDGGNLAVNNFTASSPGGTIIVLAGASDNVILRNMALHGNGSARDAIVYEAGNNLVVDNLRIDGFSGYGVDAHAGTLGTPGTLQVKDCTISNVYSGFGLSGLTLVTISNVHVYNSQGVTASSGNISITNSTFIGPKSRSGSAIYVASAAVVTITIDQCVLSSYSAGILAGNGTIQVSRTQFSLNQNGIAGYAPAVLISFGNNVFSNNQSNGSFSQTVPLM